MLHSASEDVEVFYRTLGVVPAPLFDTQVAAGLAGIGASLGYQRLVAALLAVELPKGETRTDWLARPLSAAQLAYAAEDVVHLLPLHACLSRTLAALGRLDWALADSAALLDTTRLEVDPAAAFRRVRGAGRLNRRQLGVLRALAAWRDGAAWLELIAGAITLPEGELPPEAWRPPSTAAVRELELRLRAVVRERAEALALPPELLAPRRALDAVMRSVFADPEPRLPRELGGWRRAVVGEALLAAAATTPRPGAPP